MTYQFLTQLADRVRDIRDGDGRGKSQQRKLIDNGGIVIELSECL